MTSFEVKITVTAGDILVGEPCHGSLCPIAKALRRELRVFGTPPSIVVMRNQINVNFGGTGFSATTSKAAREFIRKVDTRGKQHVKPASFVLKFKESH